MAQLLIHGQFVVSSLQESLREKFKGAKVGDNFDLQEAAEVFVLANYSITPPAPEAHHGTSSSGAVKSIFVIWRSTKYLLVLCKSSLIISCEVRKWETVKIMMKQTKLSLLKEMKL